MTEQLLDVRAAQRQVWENKQRKGFNTTDVPLELCLLQGEVAEFFEAWRRGRHDKAVGEELADVAIYVLGLAEMVGVDLADEVTRKMTKNAGRQYEVRNGVRVKVGDSTTSIRALADEMYDVVHAAAHQPGATWGSVAEYIADRIRRTTQGPEA